MNKLRTQASKTARGELVENRIVLWSAEDSRGIFGLGFYGKPLGIPKPRDADFEAPLILDLIEGYYLVLQGKLKIYVSATGRAITATKMAKICEEQHLDFREKFVVYAELRDSGFVVTPGIKFGCDYAVYEHGPGIDHAPYLVQVSKPGDSLTATGIVLSGRLATTVRKQFTIAVADLRKKTGITFLSFDWWRA